MNQLCRFVVVLLVNWSVTGNAFVTVGASPDCDFNAIEAAYDGNDNTLRVASDQIYTDEFVIEKQLFLLGGYDSCAAAESNTHGEDLTRWNGSTAHTVISINTNNGFQSIVGVDRFLIDDGAGDVGGISVKGRSTLLLSNSRVEYNDGITGGGIRVSGATAQGIVSDSLINNNDGSDGAGVYCDTGANISISGASRIANNDAGLGNGGGVFATSGCTVNSSASSMFPTGAQLQYGIIGNLAGAGAGIYLSGGATMLLQGDAEGPANVLVNHATRLENIGGGGVYVDGIGTSFVAINARIDGNSANDVGAGFVVTNQAKFEMYRLNGPCWDNSACSSLSENYIRFEGGFAAAGRASNGAVVKISQTTVAENKADDDVLFRVDRAAYLRLEGNLIYNNVNFSELVPPSLIGLSGEAANGGNVDFFYNTLSNNISQAVFTLAVEAQHHLNIFNSIVYNLGVVMNQRGVFNNIIQADCTVVQETATITGNVGFLSTANPLFVDALNNDFSLQGESVAVDMCDESLFVGANYADINGQPRGYDSISVPDYFGSYDAGAHELIGDLIFRGDFE